MLRLRFAPLALLPMLAWATPASARSFVVAKAGDKPSIAVDAAGVTHIAWDSYTQDNTSTTHYCRVPRAASKCAAGSARNFTPIPGDRDFAGPRLSVQGKRVVIVTSRCCTSQQGPDGAFHGTHVLNFVSGDGGATFGPPAWFATHPPDVGAAFGPSATFWSLGIAAGGTGLQAGPLGGFNGRLNTFTPKLALQGGVGTTPKLALVAFNDRSHVFAGVVGADPNSTPIALTQIAKGSDTRVDNGRKGPDVLYRTPGSRMRYVVRRFAGGKLGRPTAVSEAGFPIFGNFSQDGAGRIHAVWQGHSGLTYRHSATNGRGFGRFKVLSRRNGHFNLVVGANGKGRAAVAYDSNGLGRVGGFTAG